MSELDDLGEIADASAFGTGGALSKFGVCRGGRNRAARCGSPDHMKGDNIRVYRKGKNGKLRTVCKLCDAARRKKPTYGAEGYPL
jgi:hypothetical protein